MTKKMFIFYFLINLILILNVTLFSQGNEFVFTFVKADGNEIVYKNAYYNIYDLIQRTTNIKMSPEPRIIGLSGSEVFQTPFLYLIGDNRIIFNQSEKENLKKFLQGGGLLVIDDISGKINSGFDKSIKEIFSEILPYNNFIHLEMKVPIFRSFYLIKKITGLYETLNYFEGIYINGRLCVIYSHNNLLGVWEKDDDLGWKYTPSPSGEIQRFEAIKIMVNIIMYSVTGTYKLDKVHEPFIEQKMKE